MKYKNIILLILPVIIWLLLEVFLLEPKLLYISVVISLTLMLLAVRYFVRKSNIKYYPLYFVPLFVLFSSLSAYVTVISSKTWIQILFAFMAIFIFVYLKALYYFLKNHDSRKEKNIKNILFFSGFLSIFFTSAIVFILPTILNWPSWLIILIVIPIIFLTFYQFFIIKKDSFSNVSISFLINALVLTELLWILSLLPFNFNILAYFAAIFYYFLLFVQELHWQNNLSLKNLKGVLILSTVILTILFLTARWL